MNNSKKALFLTLCTIFSSLPVIQAGKSGKVGRKKNPVSLGSSKNGQKTYAEDNDKRKVQIRLRKEISANSFHLNLTSAQEDTLKKGNTITIPTIEDLKKLISDTKSVQTFTTHFGDVKKGSVSIKKTTKKDKKTDKEKIVYVINVAVEERNSDSNTESINHILAGFGGSGIGRLNLINLFSPQQDLPDLDGWSAYRPVLKQPVSDLKKTKQPYMYYAQNVDQNQLSDPSDDEIDERTFHELINGALVWWEDDDGCKYLVSNQGLLASLRAQLGANEVLKRLLQLVGTNAMYNYAQATGTDNEKEINVVSYLKGIKNDKLSKQEKSIFRKELWEAFACAYLGRNMAHLATKAACKEDKMIFNKLYPDGNVTKILNASAKISNTRITYSIPSNKTMDVSIGVRPGAGHTGVTTTQLFMNENKDGLKDTQYNNVDKKLNACGYDKRQQILAIVQHMFKSTASGAFSFDLILDEKEQQLNYNFDKFEAKDTKAELLTYGSATKKSHGECVINLEQVLPGKQLQNYKDLTPEEKTICCQLFTLLGICETMRMGDRGKLMASVVSRELGNVKNTNINVGEEALLALCSRLKNEYWRDVRHKYQELKYQKKRVTRKMKRRPLTRPAIKAALRKADPDSLKEITHKYRNLYILNPDATSKANLFKRINMLDLISGPEQEQANKSGSNGPDDMELDD